MSSSSKAVESSQALSDAVAAATAEVVALDQAKGVTSKQLKQSLRKSLEESGALNSVKAQIRKEFIENMLDKSRPKLSATIDEKRKMDLQSRIALSSVYHMLKKRNLNHSLSVFSAECGLTTNAVLSEMDVVRALNVAKESEVFTEIASEFGKGKENVVTPEAENRKSVLDLLVENMYKLTDRNTHVDMGIQCDEPELTPRERLNSELGQLRNSFLNSVRAEREKPLHSTEERMLQYQRDCDERLKKDLELQMNLFKDNELVKARIEAASSARMEYHAARLEMETEYQRRMSQNEQRESEIVRANAEADKRHQTDMYNMRQKMQREIDEMRSREMATGRKFEVEHQGLKMLELTLKEFQNGLETRERELVVREKELDERFRDATERAKAEARAGLKTELDSVLGDRRAILMERQSLNDDKAQHAANLDSLVELRVQVKDLQKNVGLRESEVTRLNGIIAKQEAIIRGEEGDLDSDRKEILKLMQRNVELEAHLKDLEPQLAELSKEKDERARTQGRYEAQAVELTRVQAHCDALEDKMEEARDTIGELRGRLHDEKLHVASLELKNSELEKLLGDKRRMLATFQQRGRGDGVEGAIGGGAGYRDTQQRFAFKKAEDFANALLSNRRQAQMQVQQQPLPPPVPLSPAAAGAPRTPASAGASGSAGEAPLSADAAPFSQAQAQAQALAQTQSQEEALAMERVQVERQRALLREEEALERTRLDAEKARLETERLELERRKADALEATNKRRKEQEAKEEEDKARAVEATRELMRKQEEMMAAMAAQQAQLAAQQAAAEAATAASRQAAQDAELERLRTQQVQSKMQPSQTPAAPAPAPAPAPASAPVLVPMTAPAVDISGAPSDISGSGSAATSMVLENLTNESSDFTAVQSPSPAPAPASVPSPAPAPAPAPVPSAETEEERKKAEEDEKKIAEARARVLARRKTKAQRDMEEAARSAVAEHEAASAPAPALGGASRAPARSTGISLSQDDSDVEITAGNISDNSDGW